MLILLWCAESQDMLDARAVVPTAVKNDDFPRRREMLHIALHIHLALLAVRGRRQGQDAEDAGLTRSVIALMVPPLPAASRPSKTMMTRRP